MKHASAIIKRATLEQIVGHRDRAIAEYARAIEALRNAEHWHRQAAPMQDHITLIRFGGRYASEPLDAFVRNVDKDGWRSILKQTNLAGLMDRSAIEAFEDELERAPPPLTAENVTATVMRLVGDADMIFRRGLVNAFSRLSRDYRSNDAFSIGSRIVIHDGFTVLSNGNKRFLGHLRVDRDLADVDRVVHVLDAKPFDRNGETSLVRALNAAQTKKPGILHTPYWRVRWFGNGNIHLFCRDEELLAAINRLLAEHFGPTLADAKR